MKALQKITADDLLAMDQFTDDYALRIELAYAQDDNLLFGERIYREDARLWLHSSLAGIVLKAAKALGEQGFTLILYDGLRTCDAQARMLKTKAVQDNPHWLEEPRLLSPPGGGGHPRGMAVDCALERGGALLDMGTPFDFLAEDPSPAHNPAHREHAHPQNIAENRTILDNAMTKAAENCGTPLMPLPQEWWDFRLPPAVYEHYEPLSDSDLPPDMRMAG